MSVVWLDFEKPVVELENKIKELREFSATGQIEVSEEVMRLERKVERLRREIYSSLSRWQRVQLARHPRRPYTLDYIGVITKGFTELHGDRLFGDDAAIVGGFAGLDSRSVMFIGHQKGRNTKENILRNFGMPHPEGYRKALRLMELAARFDRPVVTFVDTPGAYPGLGAEERGQSEAIARNLREMARLPVPIVSVVIGEGGSGGALAIAVADVVLMMENSIYSVISPEGCAAILWGDRSRAPQAAEALRLTAADLKELNVIDDVVVEPRGGAHRDPETAARTLGATLVGHLDRLAGMDPAARLRERMEKFRRMGAFERIDSGR
jgi:acetyl-CoA carboxylase carboxyl transferase subunit alpha